ncbi:hypothetical protein V5799_033248 [Amblyomma americanum]|uniref:Uncharacterized protein n=1 Tax=Amblyomma americanum TaxID=6943 RepID=A0AAQ4DNV2_AMBAM
MDAELQALVNLPVVLVHRKDLYVIVAVLSVSILGCACVLGYSFTNNARLKSSAEMLRAYIASKEKEKEPPRSGDDAKPTANAGGAADRHPATVKQPVPLDVRYGIGMAMQAGSRSPTNLSAVLSRLQASRTRRTSSGSEQQNVVRGKSPAAAASDKKVSIVYSIDEANVN